jgi:hypothetical protein
MDNELKIIEDELVQIKINIVWLTNAVEELQERMKKSKSVEDYELNKIQAEELLGRRNFEKANLAKVKNKFLEIIGW